MRQRTKIATRGLSLGLALATAGGFAGIAGGAVGAVRSVGEGLTPHTSAPDVQSRTVGNFGKVLVDHRRFSLYMLTDEKGGHIHCTAANQCLTFWPPILVAKNSKITVGSGVKGHIGHIVRGSKWQVTVNGYPVYTFSEDSGPKQSSGEGISSFGGTWYLLKAGAATSSGTPDKAARR